MVQLSAVFQLFLVLAPLWAAAGRLLQQGQLRNPSAVTPDSIGLPAFVWEYTRGVGADAVWTRNGVNIQDKHPKSRKLVILLALNFT